MIVVVLLRAETILVEEHAADVGLGVVHAEGGRLAAIEPHVVLNDGILELERIAGDRAVHVGFQFSALHRAISELPFARAQPPAGGPLGTRRRRRGLGRRSIGLGGRVLGRAFCCGCGQGGLRDRLGEIFAEQQLAALGHQGLGQGFIREHSGGAKRGQEEEGVEQGGVEFHE